MSQNWKELNSPDLKKKNNYNNEELLKLGVNYNNVI